MAETGHAGEDKTIEKAVWHYVGIGVLWASLFLTGMAFERLGLTSNLLSGIFPGETGMLRNQAEEYKDKMQTTERALDEMMRTKQALEVEVSRLRKAAAMPEQ
ncbi:MAG: hypothetical protein AB7P69_16860 [Candidatus Binatia bacterium]